MLLDYLGQQKRTIKRLLHYASRGKKRRALFQRYGGETVQELAEGQVKGDLILADLNRALGCFGRSQHQALFHGIFKVALLPFIYGDDYQANELRIKQEQNLTETKQFALIRCQRRMGKSEGVAMFASAVMATCPGATIAIFSPSRRQSGLLLDRIKEHLQTLRDVHGFSFAVGETNNKEQLWIVKDGDRRKVVALPASEKSVRGIGGNVMICEEAALMTPEFFLAVVAPILRMERTAMLAISTPQGEDNYYDTYSRLVVGGKPFFNTFVIESVCDKCKKKGVEEHCPHLRHMLPPWLSASKEDTIAHLYKAVGMEHLHRQENQGVSNKAGKDAFPKGLLDRLFNPHANPPLPSEQLRPPPYVFVAIDPNAGGANSDTALCCAFMDRGSVVVCGLESFSTSHLDVWDECLPMITGHLKEVQKNRLFWHSRFICFVEGDMNYQAQAVKRELESHVPRLSVQDKGKWDTNQVETGGKQVGLRSTHEVKEKMQKATLAYLQRGAVVFLKEMVVQHAGPKSIDPVQDLKTMLKKQLRNYRIVVKIAVDRDFGRDQVTYSGKQGGQKDDLCISFQLCIFWSLYWLQHN